MGVMGGDRRGARCAAVSIGKMDNDVWELCPSLFRVHVTVGEAKRYHTRGVKDRFGLLHSSVHLTNLGYRLQMRVRLAFRAHVSTLQKTQSVGNVN